MKGVIGVRKQEEGISKKDIRNFKLQLGNYKVRNLTDKRNRDNCKWKYMKCIEHHKDYIIFIDKFNIINCILKVDLMIGDYEAEKI